MTTPEEIANLISECLDRCRKSGFTLATLGRCLEDIRAKGHSEVDVRHVDSVMRQMLKRMVPPQFAELFPRDASADPPKLAVAVRPS